jgi:deoxyribodipyrimidine photolyase
MTTHLVWFRQDLRQHDNLALAGVVYRYTTPVGGA